MKNDQKIKNFLKKRPYLIWWVRDYQAVSEEAVVAAVLNHGDWNDFQALLQLLGTEKVSMIFKKQSRQARNNYRPRSKNYFRLYFRQYA
mgnify:CR=1 FL=1